MRLNNIGLIPNQNSVQSSSKAHGNPNLSDEELNMIQDKFPKGKNKELELYMSSGHSRVENPGSRGNNLDFRV